MMGSSRGASFGLCVLGAVIAAPCGALALDGSEPAPAHAPVALFQSPAQAIKKGLEAYRTGDVKNSVAALKYAADKGHPLAQWKLGRMYADGDGVPHDDVKAYQYFSQIVQSYDDDDPARRDIAVVSNAVVALGIYNLNGISGSRVRPDPMNALEFFQFAATNFGDPNAQYNLARMYLDGAGVSKNIGQALRWLSLAAEKSHYQAQGLLGHLLFGGQGGVARQRARGLMWLTLARENAVEAKDTWIVEAYDKAQAVASDNDRQVAKVYVESFLKRRD